MEKSIKENTKEWAKCGKVRNYFFGSKLLSNSGAYYTEDKADTRDVILAKTEKGFIVSKKSYNGAIIEEIVEICDLEVVETNFAGRPEIVRER